jgi:demethylmenaquinone methyltransferase / 2-methoxy-6-polyprenyl-1,4-benzoquinol methylase
MFDRIAPRYDLLNRCLSLGIDRRWRRVGVDALGLSPGARVLDLCTGTADVLVEWLRRDGRNRGVGVDSSREMLQHGRDKLRRLQQAGCAGLVAGEAERLPFAREAFDGAIVAFGLRNVAARGELLHEVVRVLKRGTPLVVLELGWPSGVLGWAYSRYFSQIVPWLGGWLSGDVKAYAYLPESVRQFPRPAELTKELRAAGFVEVHCRPLAAGIAQLYRAARTR